MNRYYTCPFALALALSAAARPAPLAAQGTDIARRVGSAPDGLVKMTYAARDGVCGDGRSFIAEATSAGRGLDVWFMEGVSMTNVSGDVGARCVAGPARLLLVVRDHRVIAVQPFVGPPSPATERPGSELGSVATADVSRYLLDLAAHGREDVARNAGVLEQLARLRAAGASYEEQAEVIPHTRTPGMVAIYYRTYRVKDATIGLACVSPGIQRTLRKAVGLEDDAHTRKMTREEQARHYEDFRLTMESVMASRTAAEWKAIFDRAGVPNAHVRFNVEMFEDPQALANGFFHDLPHPTVGPVRVLAPPVRLDGDGFQPAPPTPAFASETRAILRELGFSDEEAAALVKARATRDTPLA